MKIQIFKITFYSLFGPYLETIFVKTALWAQNNIIIYLQWTTIGPASQAFAAAEFLTKETKGNAWSGTPWSGQAVKWYWYTVRSMEAISFFTVPYKWKKSEMKNKWRKEGKTSEILFFFDRNDFSVFSKREGHSLWIHLVSCIGY